MAVKTVQNFSYPVGGITQVYDPNSIPDVIYLKPSGVHGMTGTISLSTSTTPSEGTSWKVVLLPSTSIAPTITLFGLSVTYPATVGTSNFSPTFVFDFWVDSNGAIQNSQTVYDTQSLNQIDGQTLMDNSIVTSKIVNGTTSGDILMVSSGNTWAETTITGNVLISNTGVTSIQAGVITNAMINASAAIALTKLAALSPSGVCVTNGSGYITTDASLPTNLGGLGGNNSSSNGIVSMNNGVTSIGSLTMVMPISVSFNPSGQCNNFVYMPYSGTIVASNAYVTETIAGTDSATVTMKINGVPVTGGVFTFPANSALDAVQSITPSGSNTFTVGQTIAFTASKTTPGGRVLVGLVIQRNS